MPPPSRILVVTSGPLSRNPRPYKEALALSRAGWNVTVLSGFETDRYRQLDETLLGGTGVAQHWLRPGRTSKLWRKLCRRLAARGHSIWERPAILGPASLFLRAAARLDRDLTIVHNEAPFWAGVQLLRRGRKVAADFEDWYAEDLLPENRPGRPLRLLASLEQSLIERGAYVSTTSGALADGLRGRYGGRRAEVITNSFPLQPAPRFELPAGRPAFFWFSQTVGAGRGLEELLAALRHTRSPSRLVLLGSIAADYRAHLLNAAPRGSLVEMEFLDLVSPLLLPEVIGRHQIGLALEHTSPPSRDLTITNKILQYLNAGLAIAATSTAGQREVFACAPEIGILLDLGRPEVAGQALDAMIAEPERRLAHARAARAAAEKTYCWEKESVRLVATVGRALAG